MQKFLVILFCASINLAYATSFNTYHNKRFNYQIDYPNFLIPQGESTNGDGQVIKNKEARLVVWGSHSPNKFEDAFNAASNELKKFKLIYARKRKNFFTMRAEEANQFVYLKTIFVCGENINMRFYYPKKDPVRWIEIVNIMTKSFRYSGENCGVRPLRGLTP